MPSLTRTATLSDTFDFVMAFAGSSTISSYVKPAISQAVQGIGVDKKCSIWETIVRLVAGDTSLLETNNVVLIYRERGEQVQCRQIGLHCPPIRVWGFEFAACGNHECRPSPYDFCIRENESGVRMVCRRCNWRSASLRLRDAEGMISRVNSTVPNVYWHEYPPSTRSQDLFVRVTKRKEGASVSATTRP